MIVQYLKFMYLLGYIYLRGIVSMFPVDLYWFSYQMEENFQKLPSIHSKLILRNHDLFIWPVQNFQYKAHSLVQNHYTCSSITKLKGIKVSGSVTLFPYHLSIHNLKQERSNTESVMRHEYFGGSSLKIQSMLSECLTNLSCPLGCLRELAQAPWSQQRHSQTSRMSLQPKLRVPSNISQPISK